MVNTEINIKKKGFDQPSKADRVNSVKGFFDTLRTDIRNGTFQSLGANDLYSHLILTFDFKNNDISFDGVSIGEGGNSKTKDLFNAIKSGNFDNVVLRNRDLKMLTECEDFLFLDFKQYCVRMLGVRSFSLESVKDVWAFQRDKEVIVRGIMKVPKKSEQEIRNLNRITPTSNRQVYIPEVDKYISNPVFPVLVQKIPEHIPRLGERYQVKELETGNNDNGLCITDAYEKIIDILRINTFWTYDYPLMNRYNFFGRFGSQYESLICYNIMDIVDAVKTLRGGRDGVLIRSLVEPCIVNKCTWYEWSPKSMVTFKIFRERGNSQKLLQTSDNQIVYDYDIDLKDIDWKYIDISLDGEKIRRGKEENFFMDIADFDTWSRILQFDSSRQINLDKF